jgi:hypothetical protein
MFPVSDGIAVGVSSDPHKPATLHLWADNQTDEAETFSVCCVATLFGNIDIYDSEGHRVLSKGDKAEEKARSEGYSTVQVCSCNVSLSLPPHTIRMVDSADISQGYTLKPGRYTVLQRNPPAPYNLKPDEHGAHPNPEGLTISIP